MARGSGDEKESAVKRLVQSMTGTWLILNDLRCFLDVEEVPKFRKSFSCTGLIDMLDRVGSVLFYG